jgi:hypothetical protein
MRPMLTSGQQRFKTLQNSVDRVPNQSDRVDMRTAQRAARKATPGFAIVITPDTDLRTAVANNEAGAPVFLATSISEACEMAEHRAKYAGAEKLTLWAQGMEEYLPVAKFENGRLTWTTSAINY